MEENRKEKKGRRSYLKDIKPGPNGEYIYTGKHISYDESVNSRLSVLIKLWIMLIPAAAATIASGLIQPPFMKDTWYTVGFCGLEIVCLASMVWAIIRLTMNGENLRDYVKKQTADAIPLRAWFTFGFAVAGLIGSIVFTVIKGLPENSVSSFIYMGLKTVTALCSVLIQHQMRSVVWCSSQTI